MERAGLLRLHPCHSSDLPRLQEGRKHIEHIRGVQDGVALLLDI